MEALGATRAKHAWPVVRLGDIGTWTRGSGIKRSETVTQGKPCIRYGEIYTSYDVVLDKPKSFVPKEVYDKSVHIQHGDLVLTLTGENTEEIGKTLAYLGDEEIAAGGDLVVWSNHGCDPLYLAYLMYSPALLRAKAAASNGNIIVHASVKKLSNITIPLPPLPVQREIVERLKRELADADSLVANFKRIAELADAEFKAELEESFIGVHGERVHLGDVCKVDGVLVKDVERYALFPHIGIDSIERGTGRLLAYRTVGEDGIKSGKYYFSSRHIIYSKIRPNLNKVAVPEFEGLCSADSYPILPSERCNRYWLAYLMRSAVFLNYVVPISNTRTGMPKVNREELLNFEFMLPPLAKQQQIVLKLDAASSQCEHLKASAKRGLRSSATLRAAILSEAFAP